MTKNNNTEITNIVLKKRGRKSKKEIELLQQNAKELQNNKLDNINVVIEENNNIIVSNKVDINSLLQSDDLYDEENIVTNDNDMNVETKPLAKKRGRKPKGGKIIQHITPVNNNKETKPNVILHLKCCLKDLQTNLLINNEIQSYNFQHNNFQNNNFQNNNFQNANKLSYDFLNSQISTTIQSSTTPNFTNNTNNVLPIQKCDDDDDCDCDDEKVNKESDIREVWKKLKQLEHNLHINNICDKKSACFWCTYDFDNPPVYIPKHFIKDSYHVYGCFCSPECATAHLMEENIDSSAKFERYHLINHIYSKIYDYKKNIKPAPNPYYMLEKYYGNLSIQEYRALLRNERLFLIVDKPLTRIMPELHEDNDDFIINNKIIPSNTYQIKKKLQSKQTKNNILTERFGLTQQS